MYKLFEDPMRQIVSSVERLTDNAFIPFDPANSDFQTFKREVSEGVELQDPDGNVMTAKDVKAFLKTLP